MYFIFFLKGALDGTHIRIDKPLEDKDSYINRKKYFSIQMQAVADHKKKFLDLYIGYPGSVHDARVFKESSIFRKLGVFCGGMYISITILFPHFCLMYLYN